MHSLVPFLTTMGRSMSRLSVESVEVSPSCVCKGGFELDSWTCFCSAMAFSLEYTLGNCEKLRVTLAGTGNDMDSMVKLGDLGVIDLDHSGFSSPWVET